MVQKVLAFDFGGTKIAAGIVDSKGKVMEHHTIRAHFEKNKAAVLEQIIMMGKIYIQKYTGIQGIGFASAGPLDPIKGKLLSPTNFQSWGTVPIVKILSQALKHTVFLENDAAAAALAEHWLSKNKKKTNLMVLTLGTGLGTGIICNNQLVRSGQSLHTEAGHMIIQAHDLSAHCSCGNFGCAEAYLSGKNFSHRFNQKTHRKYTAEQITMLARNKNTFALAAFKEYATYLSIALLNYIRLFNPSLFILTGGFSKNADLFLTQTRKNLQQHLLRPPQIQLSGLDNTAGLIGAAYTCFRHLNPHSPFFP